MERLHNYTGMQQTISMEKTLVCFTLHLIGGYKTQNRIKLSTGF